jgi:hypothetical protein
MSNFKKAVDRDGLEESTKKYLREVSDLAKADSLGVNGDAVLEPMPEFINSPSEKVISGKNNSWIVLGRDRPRGRASGYGGKGDTQAASIDIVVGRMASSPRSVDDQGEKLWIDPDFETDAARIYISQKSDIDEYFNLDGTKVPRAKIRSAIGLKADQVRVIARERIRLVTGTDKNNSQGAEIKEVGGIELVSDNDDSDLQPIPKGDNVQVALERIVDHLDSLAGIVDAFLMSQFEYNRQVSGHWHHSPFFAVPTAPSEILIPAGQKNSLDLLQKVKQSLFKLKINLGAFKVSYLTPAGEKYINSRKNRTN